MRIASDDVDRLLATWPVARLATRGEGGRPVQVPVVFVSTPGLLWSPVDGKPKAGAELARIRNVERDPRVSVLLDHYDADWTLLWWLRVDGEARVLRSPHPDADPELAPVVERLLAKYPQYARVPLFRGTPTLLRVAIDATTSWCASRDALSRSARR